MNQARAAATASGILGVAAILLSAVPYALLDGSSVAGYYGVGAIGPPIIVLFVAVAVVAAFAGAAERSDPPTVAAVTLVLGLTAAGFGVWWAVAAGDVVGGLPIEATFDYHRWVLAGLFGAQTIAAAWYARAVL